MITGIIVRNKDEPNLIEWILYHLNLGFNHILINDDNSNPSAIEIVKDYNNQIFKKGDGNILNIFYQKYGPIDTDKLEIVNVLKNKKRVMFELSDNEKFWQPVFNYLNKYNLDYLFQLDMDEYVVLNNKYKTIQDFIKRSKYNKLNQLHINWVLFGNNNYSSLKHYDKTSLIKLFTKSSPYLDNRCKSLVKYNVIKNCVNPHYFNINTNLNNYNLLLQDCLINVPSITNILYNSMDIYIAHFMVKDTKNYLERRFINITATLFKKINNTDEFKEFLKSNILLIINWISNKESFNNEKIQQLNGFKTYYLTNLKKIKEFYDNINQNTITNLDLINRFLK